MVLSGCLFLSVGLWRSCGSFVMVLGGFVLVLSGS